MLLLLASATFAVVNAHIWTADAAQPQAEAIAAEGSRIVAVGTSQDIRRQIGPATTVVDAHGATLIPGFIDAHLHALWYRATATPPLFLRFKRSKREFVLAVQAQAGALSAGAWVTGDGWHERQFGGAMPARAWVDAVTPRNPVWLLKQGGEPGLANAVALRLAGLDERAFPDGLVRGAAMARVDAAIVDANSADARRRSPNAPFSTGSGYEFDDRVIERVLRRLAAAGITSIHHTGSWHELLVFQRLHREGRLPVRIYACTQLPAWRRLAAYVAEHGRGDDWLRWGCLKGYGAMSPARCYESVSGAAKAGLQVTVHVFPEPGLPALLDIYARVRREQPGRDPRFRVEHAHTMPPDILRRFVEAGAIASVQPPLLRQFGPYPWQDVLASGVRIALGTDSVATASFLSPLESIQLALAGGLHLEQALQAYTAAAAFAGFAEERTGSLASGKLADFVLFERELTSASLASARIRMTVIDGKPVNTGF